MRFISKSIIVLCISIFLHASLGAQEYINVPRVAPLTRILFIFDGSMSMIGMWENRSKIEVARSVLVPFLDSISKIPNIEMASRAI